MKKFLSLVAIAGLIIGFAGHPIPVKAAVTYTPISGLHSGDLIRGQSFSAVYFYGKDGFRYVFPTDRVFFSWYANFDGIKWLTDADLSKVQIGGNVTYKPGLKMIKINTDPKTYAVSKGGTLRWVTSESVATALFGPDWNTKIDDVADAFFPNYRRGVDLENASDYDAAAEQASVVDVNDDKDLKAPTYIDITDNAFSSTSVTIKAGTAVRWTNRGVNKHSATADDLNWGTGTLNNGENFSRYFKTAGTYTYFCSYHPDMRATIIVE